MVARASYVDVTQRMIYLRSIPVAALLPSTVLKIVASYLEERTFVPGELLMREGEPIRGLHLLTEGKVSLNKGGARLGQLAAPQSLGYLGILARSLGGYDARAESEIASLELPAEALLELMEDHAPLLSATLRYLSERMLQELREMPVAMLEGQLVGDDPERLARSLDLVERILYLRKLGAFGRTNLNALATLARSFTELRLPPGHVLWRTGELPHHTHFIVAGRVRCEDGDRVWHAGANSVIGGFEVIARRPRWSTATAVSPLVCLAMPPDAFVDLLEDDFGMAMDFISMLATMLSGWLEKKASMGQAAYEVKRDVSALGAVPVGAG